MVTRSVLILSAALLMKGVAQARTVKHVEIEALGLILESAINKNAIAACKKFKPTKEQVIRFFDSAYPVESYVLTTERYSSCYAKGSLMFSDGSFGTWILYSSGTALFTFNRGDVVFFFHKNNGWHDPYACTYGLGDKGQC